MRRAPTTHDGEPRRCVAVAGPARGSPRPPTVRLAALGGLLATPAAHAETGNPALGWFGDNPVVGWLLIVALLLMWLLSRVHRRERGLEEPRRRRSPITPDELARSILETVLAGDVRAYRHLYLTGGECRQIFGDRASLYLERRPPSLLQDAFRHCRTRLPRGAVYEGVEMVRPQVYVARFRTPEGSRGSLPLGTAIRVGRVYRLQEPPDFTDGGEPNADPAPRGAPDA